MRANVVGVSGSGKSTFSKKLSEKLSLPYIEMDQLFWGPDWYLPADEEFFARLEEQLYKDAWVLDGNYSRTLTLKWQRADTVIWIDYSFTRTLYQSISRALRRAMTQQELWPDTDNRETFKKLFSKDSIVLWMLRNYKSSRVKYRTLMQDEKYSHIKFVHIKSPKKMNIYLESF